MSDLERLVVNDAQTSGGLLVALTPQNAEAYLAKMKAAVWVIGTITNLSRENTNLIVH